MEDTERTTRSEKPSGAAVLDPPEDPGAADDLFDQPTGFQPVCVQMPGNLNNLLASNGEAAHQARVVSELQRSDPETAARLADAARTMPEAGTEFLGFRLIAELGRGALGRAFLAEQKDLAGRPVVLKIAPDVGGECHNLAQLQHTNVVPIYSIHRSGSLQAVCMPYFGATTLASILGGLRGLESLPESGKHLVNTLVDRSNTTRRLGGPGSSLGGPVSTVSSEPAPVGPVQTETAPSPTFVPSGPILEMLEGLTYVEAVQWIGCRLAAGLAHAHERGILHRDLKPANILLTDEGQPMLLDFNLSQDTKLSAGASAALVGGTLPFMAPEQLEAYRAHTCVLTFTSDLHSLGVILYELLTGRHPFPVHTGPLKQVLDGMIADRRKEPPAVRRWNQAVSPALESIVRHCLEPDPARRYQTARELQEDLERQSDNLPLKYAPEPSLVERARKWTRRHPRLASSTSVALAAAVVFLILTTALLSRGRQLARREATDALGRFLEEEKSIECLLVARSADPSRFEHGLTEGKRLLDSYQVLENPSWQDTPAVRNLAAEDRAKLHEQMGKLLFLYAQALLLQGHDHENLERARRANEAAHACYDGDAVPRALRMQQAELAGLQGDSAKAQSLRAEAERVPLRTVEDRYLLASEDLARGRLRQALPRLQEAIAQDPQDFWSWFLLGVCQDGLSRTSDAASAYSTCIALWPKLPWPYYNRGLAHMRQWNYHQARADFDEAIRLRSDVAEMYLQRALALQGLKDYAAAIRDLDRALELGADPTRVCLQRAEARRRAGDAAGAARDREAGLRKEPTDAQGWLTRGYARMAGEPKAALEDFDHALQLDPVSLTGLQNKASVLGSLGRDAEAVAVLDRELALYPDYVLARAGRAVHLARLGRREEAQRDAEECLKRDPQPLVVYQVAGAYALTAHQHPEDRQRALRLLCAALQKGCGFDLLGEDTDLDRLRNDPEFRELVAATRSIRRIGGAR